MAALSPLHLAACAASQQLSLLSSGCSWQLQAAGVVQTSLSPVCRREKAAATDRSNTDDTRTPAVYTSVRHLPGPSGHLTGLHTELPQMSQM